jgi:hypothetical protein
MPQAMLGRQTALQKMPPTLPERLHQLARSTASNTLDDANQPSARFAATLTHRRAPARTIETLKNVSIEAAVKSCFDAAALAPTPSASGRFRQRHAIPPPERLRAVRCAA